MHSTALQDKKQWLIFYFMLAWVVMNLLQAAFTGLDGDEAYYWMFSRQLQWGYFDHPPMVALSIKLGELLGHGPLFTRLGTVVFSAGAIFFGYKAVPEHLRNPKYYILSFSSVVLLNMYGFIVTPDSSLFFFTALFFYAYRLYLEKTSPSHILLLALSITGLLYSKYHGVLPVFFTFLSNPRLVFRSSAWIIVFLVIGGFAPHLWWQYQHDWPTMRYHLLERVASAYRIDKTTNYIGGQLVIWGPLTTIPALYFFLKTKPRDVYMRAHYFTLWGVFIFFLLSSFRSTIEPHWTLTAGVSFIVLLQQLLSTGAAKLVRAFSILLTVDIVVILLVRIFFILPDSPLNKVKGFNSIFYGKQMADSIYKYASGTPVLFLNSYTQPSLYKYYHRNELTTGYNTVSGRKNYFNLSNDEALLNDRNVFLATGYDFGPALTIKGWAEPIRLYHFDSFKAVNALKIDWLNKVKKAKRNGTMPVHLDLLNTGSYAVHPAQKLYINYNFIKTKKEIETGVNLLPISEEVLLPGYKKLISAQVILPATPGNYRLLFSIVQPPFDGSFASRFYNVKVE